MSVPSSTAAEQLACSVATSPSITGRAAFQNGSDVRYAKPSDRMRGVSANARPSRVT